MSNACSTVAEKGGEFLTGSFGSSEFWPVGWSQAIGERLVDHAPRTTVPQFRLFDRWHLDQQKPFLARRRREAIVEGYDFE